MPVSPIKIALLDRGITQKEMARRLELSEAEMSRIANGWYPQKRDLRRRLSKQLEIPQRDLWPNPNGGSTR